MLNKKLFRNISAYVHYDLRNEKTYSSHLVIFSPLFCGAPNKKEV